MVNEQDNKDFHAREWITYKTSAAVEFVQMGYSVSWHPDPSNFITVFKPPTLRGEEYYIADAKFYQKASPFGINRGAVSKLLIVKYRGQLEKLITGMRPWSQLIYNYDRGLDVDLLDQDARAKRMYDDVLFVLNNPRDFTPPEN